MPMYATCFSFVFHKFNSIPAHASAQTAHALINYYIKYCSCTRAHRNSHAHMNVEFGRFLVVYRALFPVKSAKREKKDTRALK